MHGDRVALIGYVLERDDVAETVLRPGGGILTVPRDAVTAAVTCQFEAESDPGTDAPPMAYLPAFHPVAPERQSPTCAVALREAG